MELSLNIIKDYLCPKYNAEKIGAPMRKNKLKRPVLYPGHGPLLSDRFYVIRTDLLPSEKEIKCQCVICVGRGSTAPLAGAKCSGLLIQNTTDYIQVFNDICDIFNHFDSWEDAMRAELEEDANFDYHRIALIGTHFLNNTIGLSDQFLRVLFTTDFDSNGDIQIITGKYDDMLMKVDDQIAHICQQEKKLRTPYLSAFSIYGAATPYCYNIFTIDHFVGCCFIHPDRHPFSDSDYELADVFFHYFEKAFVKSIHNFSNQENVSLKAMETLFMGLPLSKTEQELFSLAENESWVLFRLCPQKNIKSMPQNYMHATICSLMPNTAFAALDGEKVIGILKVQRNLPLNKSTSISSLCSIILHMGYIACLSNEFRDLAYISEYRFQAEYTLRFAERSQSTNKEFYLFTDCVLDYMLTACCTRLSLDSLFSRQFKNLLEYDRIHDASYCKTLECYLRNEMSIAITARELYLHRSSLIKRLDRIKAILECDLTNPNLKLYYRICFELLHRTKIDDFMS